MAKTKIDNEAAVWVARLDREPGSPALQAELELWLEADRRHRGAFLRAQAAWFVMDRAQVLPMPSTHGALSRRLLIGAGAAAAAAAAGLAIAPLVRAKKQVFETARGEIRRVQLQDGSIAAINSETTLEVTLGARLRHVRLLRGDAWFQVAHDADRPFVVETNRMQVRAVGTAFAVAAEDHASKVLVSEGVVEVAGLNHRKPAARLGAGSQGSLAEDGELHTAAMPLDAISRSLAWREAQIALDGDTLAQAVEKFNRYNLRKLVIEEPALADRELVGWFWMNDPESFARAAALSLGAKVSMEPDRIVLAKRGGAPG